jgi:hypothetical protein
VHSNLVERIRARASGIGLYGIAPPRRSIEPEKLAELIAHQETRFAKLGIDGLIVYDIQDESARNQEPRPFPFLPTIDPERYAHEYLAGVPVPKIVYRAVPAHSADTFASWLRATETKLSVFVGAASSRASESPVLKLPEAYALAAQHAPSLMLGGIAIAERHGRDFAEHTRLLAKTEQGCRFFVTQAVFDVSSSKSLLSDYALECAKRGVEPQLMIFTFAPCGSEKTLEFMKWLGISFPRWLENELRYSRDILEKSVQLSVRIFAELAEFAAEKKIPVGVNVESVSIRKAEIEASVELFKALRGRSSFPP